MRYSSIRLSAAGHHGPQLRASIDRAFEPADGGAQQPHAPVGFAVAHVSVRQQRFEAAAGQQGGQRGLGLRGPLLLAGFAAGVGVANLFLPAEDGGVLGHGHRGDDGGCPPACSPFRPRCSAPVSWFSAPRGLGAQALQPLPGFGEGARHLVHADQPGHERRARLAGQHMAVQLGQHRLLRAGGDGAGRDRVASRPPPGPPPASWRTPFLSILVDSDRVSACSISTS